MTLYDIELGDWSSDGHGISEKFYFETPDDLSREALLANYRRNIRAFGFGPEDFAKNYEDSRLPRRYYNLLSDLGFVYEPGNSWEELELWDSKEPETSDYALSGASMFAIVLFFLSHGLPDPSVVRWVKTQSISLTGSAGVGSIGYGLYSN